MVSYPFFSDQPGLAARCQELRLAEPLAEELRGTVTTRDIYAALERVQNRLGTIRQKLAEARAWELAVMARRPAVIERILGLA
jgi:hypothetical protein